MTEAFTALMRKAVGAATKKQAIEDGDGGVQFKPTSGSSKARSTTKAGKPKPSAKKPAEAPPSKKVRSELAKALSIVDQIEDVIAPPGAKRTRGAGKSGGVTQPSLVTGGLRPGKA